MKITFAPRGILQIDDARIIYRNFAGRGDKYNREGDRNFSVIINDEAIKDELLNDVNEHGASWNVKIKPPREEGDAPFMYLPVKFKIREYDKNGRKLMKPIGPDFYLRTGNNLNKIDFEDVAMFDEIEIEKVDMDIRPYDDVISGKPFRAAYLQSICVTQKLDRFAARYATDTDEPLPF